jgi:NAD(P)-dependent dehydrogenase (short-subunit alcohol dehydrogenase family)
MRLSDKVAVITGAASGIGRAAALLFAREGAAIVGADVDATGGRATVEQIERDRGHAIFVETDVADEAQVRAMVEAGAARFGKIDVLCNIAGIGEREPYVNAVELELRVFERTMQVNVNGPFLCSKYVIPHMLHAGGGSIVNISSIAALQGGMVAPITAYGTSKAAVIGLTKQLAMQFASQHVRVNAICPGPVDTPIIKPFQTPGYRERYAARTPIGRMGEAEDVASLCLYLASDESFYMTGSIIVMDGGITSQ